MSTRIINAQGIISSEVPTGNLLWVDPVNGVNGLAVRGRLTIPFRTLTAAKDAAKSGDTIMVLPGTYNEKNLLKSLVNWHFFPGARILYTAGASGAIFDTSASTGTGTAVECMITGAGDFSNDTNEVLKLSTSGSVIYFQALQLFGGGTCAQFSGAADSVTLEVQREIRAGSGHGLLVEGGTCIVRAYSLYSSGGSALRSTGGTFDVTANSLFATNEALAFAGASTSGLCIVRASEIRSGANAAVIYSAGSPYPALHIHNARIKSDYNNAAGRAIYFSSTPGTSNTSLKLVSCVLLTTHATAPAAPCIEASSAQVQIQGGALTNKTGPSGITLKPAGTSFVIDPSFI